MKCFDFGLELLPPVKIDFAFNVFPKDTTATNVFPVAPYLTFEFTNDKDTC